MCGREMLAHGRMMRIHPDDCLDCVPEKETGHIVLQGLVEDLAPLAFAILSTGTGASLIW